MTEPTQEQIDAVAKAILGPHRSDGITQEKLMELREVMWVAISNRSDRQLAINQARAAIATMVTPEVTVQDAAKALLSIFDDPDANAPKGFDWQGMYTSMTLDHQESVDESGQHDWPSVLTVALRALSEGGEC